MGAELLLYGYGLVCISMLVFNIVYGLSCRTEEGRVDRIVAAMEKRIRSQLDLKKRESQIGIKHLNWMKKKLSRAEGLMSFDRFLEDWELGEKERDVYLSQLQPVILELARVYLKKENTQAAYFCHVMDRHRLYGFLKTEKIWQVMLSYLWKDSLYCRVNALRVLCGSGRPQVVIKALMILGGRPRTFLSGKVITEELVSYRGDTSALIKALWKNFEGFTLMVQRSVLDYIRLTSGDWQKEMESILNDPGRDKELRFSAIRYFGRYPYPPVKETLLCFAREKDPLRWEFAAISVGALGSYRGKRVEKTLVEAMRSPNWYVRYNASSSLLEQEVSLKKVRKSLADDPYGAEMISYRREAWKKKEESQGELLEEKAEKQESSSQETPEAAPPLKEAAAVEGPEEAEAEEQGREMSAKA